MPQQTPCSLDDSENTNTAHTHTAHNHDNTDIAHAIRVLHKEAEGLRALAGSLDHSFSEAIDAIHAMKSCPDHSGRVIVTGIGKSGHIGHKIAATLSSTGTPSFFVHAGEASHGDLGMLTPADIVLMLSNSGENPELSDLIHYTRRYGITLIAITSNENSALARHADIVLRLPPIPEACPNGLAPTTSSTMMLALGDAIAVVLLQRMGLTPAQYRAFHPGGKLGKKLISVGEIMHPHPALPLLPNTARMDAVILELSAKNLGAVLILDAQGALCGIVTDGDLKRHMAPDLLSRQVDRIMSQKPRTIRADALAVEALKIMTQDPNHYVTSLVVVDDSGNLTGLIRLQDCLQAGIA